MNIFRKKENDVEILAVIHATNMLSSISNIDPDCKEFVKELLIITKPILFLNIGYHNIQYLVKLRQEYERVLCLLTDKSEKDAE